MCHIPAARTSMAPRCPLLAVCERSTGFAQVCPFVVADATGPGDPSPARPAALPCFASSLAFAIGCATSNSNVSQPAFAPEFLRDLSSGTAPSRGTGWRWQAALRQGIARRRATEWGQSVAIAAWRSRQLALAKLVAPGTCAAALAVSSAPCWPCHPYRSSPAHTMASQASAGLAMGHRRTRHRQSGKTSNVARRRRIVAPRLAVGSDLLQ